MGLAVRLFTGNFFLCRFGLPTSCMPCQEEKFLTCSEGTTNADSGRRFPLTRTLPMGSRTCTKGAVAPCSSCAQAFNPRWMKEGKEKTIWSEGKERSRPRGERDLGISTDGKAPAASPGAPAARTQEVHNAVLR